MGAFFGNVILSGAKNPRSPSFILHSAFCILHSVSRCVSQGAHCAPLQTDTGGERRGVKGADPYNSYRVCFSNQSVISFRRRWRCLGLPERESS